MISIIVPFYNCIKYIDYAKKNFNQFNDVNFELIFVNDGSTDNSLEKMQSAFPFAKFYSQVNQGAGVARDLGIDNAEGSFIAFCDIDDFMYVEKLLKIVDEMGHADIAIGESYRTWIKEGEIKKQVLWKEKVFTLPSYYPIDYPIVYSDSIMMNKVYKAKFLKDSGCKFPTGKYEDKKYLFDLFQLNPFIKTFKYHFYDWNVFENSSSQTNTKNLDDIVQRFEVCLYQISNSTNELKKFLIGNTISHDVVLYAKDYEKFDLETREKLYFYFNDIRKMTSDIEQNYFTQRGYSLIKITNFNDFDNKMSKLYKKETLFNRVKKKFFVKVAR